jgi:hypothetical protein
MIDAPITVTPGSGLPSPTANAGVAVTTTAPAPPVPSTTVAGTGWGVLVTAVLSGAFLAALITTAINIWLARRKSREDERNRLRTSFADAFAAYSAYKEFPYAIRRRRADTPGEERIRLSEALREIQANLAYHLAWTATESEHVGQAYAMLIHQVRRTAGAAMHDAWNAPPTDTDDAMNIPPDVIDLSSLTPHENAYIDTVRTHLQRLVPWWSPVATPAARPPSS